MKGSRCASFIACWAIATDSNGGPLGDGEGVHAAVLAYGEYWGDKERTVYNRLAEFRSVFPHETPQVIVDLALAQNVEAAAITSLPPNFALA